MQLNDQAIKASAIAETFIKPYVTDIFVLGDKLAKQINNIPLTIYTVWRRINNISTHTNTVISHLKCNNFS